MPMHGTVESMEMCLMDNIRVGGNWVIAVMTSVFGLHLWLLVVEIWGETH